MNRRPSEAVATRSRRNVTSAVDTLLNGYREEAELYVQVRQLTWRQRDALRNKMDLNLFRDLLGEKENLLRTISQVESEMRSARSLVLSYPPSQVSDRRNLELLLDHLTDTIEEIRIIESNNARLLEAAPAN